jgi:hypothetical protein
VALLCGLVRGLIYLLGESAAYLLNLIDDIPLIICWIVGIRVAVRRWRVHPEVCRLAVLGISINLSVLLLWQSVWIGMGLMQSRLPIDLLALPLTAFSAVAWVLLLIAAFGWREAADSQSGDFTTAPAPPLAGR